MERDSEKQMEDVIRADGRYPLEAFAFLNEGLGRAVGEVHGEETASGVQKHVTGKQLCESLARVAVERWGLLAKTVLAKWNIHATIDFGNMVYLLVENDFMRKTDEDSLEDFRDVFNFDTAFAPADGFELKE